MPAIGLAQLRPDAPPLAIEQQTGKQPRISKRIKQVVDLLVSGECKTQKAASERCDLHPDYVCRELKKPQVRVFIERRARETIASGLMRASARLNELVDAGSEHVSLDATKHLLGIAGIKPAADAQVSVNIELKAGYVIDLSEGAMPMKAVTNVEQSLNSPRNTAETPAIEHEGVPFGGESRTK